jgi:indole-3-glycerol phosphate synthase
VANVLAEILAHKRTEVEQARQARPIEELQAQPGYFLPRRNFYGAVAVPQRGRPNLIAEVKHKSPSAGVIRPDFDPVAIAQMYHDAGAQALSVLTDEKYFAGRLEYLEQIKSEVPLPVLRKDFVVDAYQLYESRAAGADAVLLIADALGPPAVRDLLRLARSLELTVLLEVHERTVLHETLSCVSEDGFDGLLLGINNRNLKTQTVDLETTVSLAPTIPPGVPIVAESGIKTRKDVERMHAAGARALLIGESLLRQPDPRQAIQALFG